MVKHKASGAFDVPDDYVPTDNDDLVETFGPFVTRLVTRYNKVSSNFEDLLQHVWMKLIDVDVIGKYAKSGGSLPKKLTAIQACAYLQVTWGQFKVAIWRGQMGDDREEDRLRIPKALQEKVLARDAGVCHRCSRNMVSFQDALEKLRERDATLAANKLRSYGLSPKKKLFWVAEKVGPVSKQDVIACYKTTCYFCATKGKKAKVRSRSEWAPKPIEGTWASKKALYDRVDIERLRIIREEQGRCKKHEEIDPIIFQTKGFFKLYLARSVSNIYKNWCRTRSRRYKETYKDYDEVTGKPWEETLDDPFGARQDNLLEVYLAIKMLASGASSPTQIDTAKKYPKEEEIMMLLSEGWDPPDIVQKLGLPKTSLSTFAHA